MTPIAQQPLLMTNRRRAAALRRDEVVRLALATTGLLALSSPRFFSSSLTGQFGIGIGFLLLLLRPLNSGGRRRASQRWPSTIRSLLVFAAWCALSAMWSEHLSVTVQTSVVALLAILFGDRACRILKPSERHLPLLLFPLLACLASLVLVVLAPTDAIVDGYYRDGALRGIYVHRNQLAYVAAVGFVMAAWHIARASNRQLRSAVIGVPSLIVLIMSESATAIAVAALATTGVILVRQIVVLPTRSRSHALIALLALFAAAAAFLSSQTFDVLAVLGRDSTLTGRTQLWKHVLNAVGQRPLLGYGWGSAWLDESAVQIDISSKAGFRVYHAHNSVLDLLLQVGIIGLVIFAVSLFQTLRATCRDVLSGTGRATPGALALPLLFAMVLGSVTSIAISEPLGLAMLAYLARMLTARVAITKDAQDVMSAPQFANSIRK